MEEPVNTVTVIALPLVAVVVVLIVRAMRRKTSKPYKSENAMPPARPPATDPVEWPEGMPPPGQPKDL